MTGMTPPLRSLLYVRPAPGEPGALEIGCDCGTVTVLVTEGAGQMTERQEMAVTCDGCGSAHWFTIGPEEK